MKKLSALLLALLLLLTAAIAAAEDVAISEYTEIGGVRYRPRQNVITYLLIGTDDQGDAVEKPEYDGHGQSDVLWLLVIDKAADTYALITVDRDTVTPVHSIGEDGEDLGAYPVQISLAHANGKGGADSCENTARAVSDLLLGVRIDHYFAVTMDAIPILNSAIGGVEVTVEDDFSASDPSLKMGETVLLSDAQAVSFLRGRMTVGDGANQSRMRRQQAYLNAARPKLEAKYREDASFPIDLAHSLSACSVTDMTDKDFSYIAKAILENRDLGTFTLPGVTDADEDGWTAFRPDPDGVADLVADLFYLKAEE